MPTSRAFKASVKGRAKTKTSEIGATSTVPERTLKKRAYLRAALASEEEGKRIRRDYHLEAMKREITRNEAKKKKGKK